MNRNEEFFQLRITNLSNDELQIFQLKNDDLFKYRIVRIIRKRK